MEETNFFKKTSLKTMKSKPERFLQAFKDYGFIVFSKANYTDKEIVSIVEIFSTYFPWENPVEKNEEEVLESFFVTEDSEIRDTYVRKGLNFTTSRIGDPLAACVIKVEEIETPPDQPEYQIMLQDMQKTFFSLPTEFQKFLNKTSIQTVPTFIQSEEEISKFIRFSLNGCDPIWNKLPENLPPESNSKGIAEAFFATPAVEESINTESKCLKISTSKIHGKAREHICKFDGRLPSEKEKEMFNQIFSHIEEQLEQFELEKCFMHPFSVGDVILIDAQRMMIGSASYKSKKEKLKHFEIYEKNKNFTKKTVSLDSNIDVDKLTTMHNYLSNKKTEEKLDQKKKKRPQKVQQ